jgi:hypothetical protein
MSGDNIVQSMKGNNFGCIVEWRYNGPPITTMSVTPSFELPPQEWRIAPYELNGPGPRTFTKHGRVHQTLAPLATDQDKWLGNFGICTRLHAEAIMACLRTYVAAHPDLSHIEDRIEFRVTDCELKLDYTVTKRAAVDGRESGVESPQSRSIPPSDDAKVDPT